MCLLRLENLSEPTSFFLTMESVLLLEGAFFQNGFLEGRDTFFGNFVNNFLNNLVRLRVPVLNDNLLRLPFNIIVAVLVLDGGNLLCLTVSRWGLLIFFV